MLSRKLTPWTLNFPKWKDEDMTLCERWHDCMWPHENMHLCLEFLDVKNEELINGAESTQKKKPGTLWENTTCKCICQSDRMSQLRPEKPSRAGLSCQFCWPPAPTHITSTHLICCKGVRGTKMKDGKTEGNGKRKPSAAWQKGKFLRGVYTVNWQLEKHGIMIRVARACAHTYTRAQALKTIMMSNKKHPDSTYLTKPLTSGLPLGKKTHLHRTT